MLDFDLIKDFEKAVNVLLSKKNADIKKNAQSLMDTLKGLEPSDRLTVDHIRGLGIYGQLVLLL